jgi:hypothetical protein
MSGIEKRGKPTLTITSSSFVEDAHWSAKAFGCPEMQLLEVPQPITNQTADGINAMIDAALDQVEQGLVAGTYAPPEKFEHHVVSSSAALRYEGGDLLECLDRMNRAFIESGWSDGLPLVAPTREKVARMVAASGRDPAEVVGVFEPGFGVGTVEKIAANAVMAGCEANAMPVVLAIAETILVPRFGLRSLAMSTGPQAPVVMVSGPYADAIGMNRGVCALGPGSISSVNVAIGRSLRLLMMNIGLSYPGVSDMDTIGTPLKFSACVAENEARTPWDPFRVSKGFAKDSTTVTLHAPYGLVEVFDFYNTTPEKLAQTFGYAICNMALPTAGAWLINNPGPRDGTGPFHGDYELPIMMCPEHAEVFARAGWTRKDVQQAIFDACRLPFKVLMHNKPPEAFAASNPQLQWLWDQPDTEVSYIRRADFIDIFVVGGDAGRSLYWSTGGAGVTTEVKLKA